MAYDEELATRVRLVLAERGDVAERKMFGGLCFLVGGNMAVGIVASDLMVRVGPEAYTALLGRPHAREMDFTGRPMRGMVYVDAAGLRSRQQLVRWVGRGVEYASGLPVK